MPDIEIRPEDMDLRPLELPRALARLLTAAVRFTAAVRSAVKSGAEGEQEIYAAIGELLGAARVFAQAVDRTAEDPAENAMWKAAGEDALRKALADGGEDEQVH